MIEASALLPPAHWQQARITAIERRTPTVTSFFFAPAMPFGYRAGQHVDVRLTASDGYTAQRSYSIASAPSAGGDLELAIDRLPDGEVSPFFHDIAQVGDDIELRGPLGGHFVWDAQDPAPMLLIGGGSGVVPLAAMARERAAVAAKAPMALLYSARTFHDLIFRDEFVGLAKGENGLHLVLTLTRDASAHPDVVHNRRVDQAMVRDALALLPSAPGVVYVCGSNGFVSAVATVLTDAGVAPTIIRTERYGT
jgi:ferredoxin-NADP reductase